MIKPEDKLNIMISHLNNNVIGLDNLSKFLFNEFKKKLGSGQSLKEHDIDFVNEIWNAKNKTRCSFCSADTYTQDGDCVDCGFSKKSRPER
jgi:hypothetical protein